MTSEERVLCERVCVCERVLSSTKLKWPRSCCGKSKSCFLGSLSLSLSYPPPLFLSLPHPSLTLSPSLPSPLTASPAPDSFFMWPGGECNTMLLQWRESEGEYQREPGCASERERERERQREGERERTSFASGEPRRGKQERFIAPACICIIKVLHLNCGPWNSTRRSKLKYSRISPRTEMVPLELDPSLSLSLFSLPLLVRFITAR